MPIIQSKGFLMRLRTLVSSGRLGTAGLSGERTPSGFPQVGKASLGQQQEKPKTKISSSEVKPSLRPWGDEEEGAQLKAGEWGG